MILFYIKNTEIIFGETTLANGMDWLISKIYTNDKRYFYFSLTIVGFSVTIRKRKSTLKGHKRRVS